MIPSPWIAVVLALAAYRWTRLAGWDDFPPIYKLRAWAIGETWIPKFPPAPDPDLPGKQPSSEVPMLRPAYSRPLLAHLVHCPFCVGWWISLATYSAWLLWPHATMYVAAPFALSGVVGLVSKNWDA